ARRPCELPREVQRRVEVEDVVVTEFLPVQLLRRRNAGAGEVGFSVEGRRLVRVLSIPERLLQEKRGGCDFRQRIGGRNLSVSRDEVILDGEVIAGDSGERDLSQIQSHLPSQSPGVIRHYLQNATVKPR